MREWEARWWRMARENDRLRARLGSALREISRLSERDECAASPVMTPPDGWRRLKRDMQHVLTGQPLIAHAVLCLPMCDVLELQLELLRQPDWPEFEDGELLPPNVIRFRPRRR